MDDVLGYAGRRVVVTGAASGMGKATAEVLVGLGAEVTALDIAATEVAGVTDVPIDLRDRGAIDAAVVALGEEPVQAVFNCAGLPGPPFSDLDVLLVNFLGPRHLIERLGRTMPQGSAVAWVASAAGMGWQGQLASLMPLIDCEGFEAGTAWCETHPEALQPSSYAVSKQLINAYVAARAGRFLEQGIRLNCTNPGPTETPMMRYFHDSAGKDLVDAAMGPLGRYSTPEEQAWPLVMLNSPRMTAVTGTALFADGGFFGALQTGQVDFSQRPGSQFR